MATEEWVKRAILGNKQYDDLPQRVRAVLPVSEYRAKAKDLCILKGFRWGEGLSAFSSTEHEYYEDLLRFFRQSMRLFPYHLAEYVCRVLRTTPFRYYCDLLYAVLREERSFDYIPNFTAAEVLRPIDIAHFVTVIKCKAEDGKQHSMQAADVVRVTGIGRNEYIATMNKCKAKKLLWRVNKALAKEFLPTEPLVPAAMQPWWLVATVNLGQAEFQALSSQELATCTEAAKPGSARVGDLDPGLVGSLYRKGLLYFSVPIWPDDHVSIPPLEGFVSNKDTEGSETQGDPLEAVLYAVFVATSARASVAELGTILQVDLPRLTAAISIACRLGFATRLPNAAHDGSAGVQVHMTADAATPSSVPTTPPSASQLSSPATLQPSPSLSQDGSSGDQGVALVVDAEVTSYLMMGALSPALKRHSVTLFEGGRVTGADVIAEMIDELFTSADMGAQFEGDMRRLASYARALATALACVREAAQGRSVELLRKESLAGLAPAAAARVLSHAYMAVIPITPLPFPPLPLSPLRPGPTHFGPSAEACTPWLQIALGCSAQAGLQGVVLVCGQRLWHLPPQLQAASHVLLWPWDMESVRALEVPVVLEAQFLLYTLNEYLSHTAVLVQPVQAGPGWVEDTPLYCSVDVPLPLSPSLPTSVTGVDPDTQQEVEVKLPSAIGQALESLGIARALGVLRLMRLAPHLQSHLSSPASVSQQQDVQQQASAGSSAAPDQSRPSQEAPSDRPEQHEPIESPSAPDEGPWVPLWLHLGMPLYPDALCALVCRQAGAADFLSPHACAAHLQGQLQLTRRLGATVAQYGACTDCLGAGNEGDATPFLELPVQNLLFDGTQMQLLDYSQYQHGISMLCIE